MELRHANQLKFVNKLTSLKQHMPQPFRGDIQRNRKQSNNRIQAS